MIGLFGETVTISRKVGDGYSTPITSTVVATVPGCSVQAQSSVEPRDGASLRVVTNMVVYLPAGTVVKSTDTLTIRGDEYQVEGTPIPETNIFTGTPGMVPVTVRRTTG